MTDIKIALLGLGTVGSGVVKVLLVPANLILEIVPFLARPISLSLRNSRPPPVKRTETGDAVAKRPSLWTPSVTWPMPRPGSNAS